MKFKSYSIKLELSSSTIVTVDVSAFRSDQHLVFVGDQVIWVMMRISIKMIICHRWPLPFAKYKLLTLNNYIIMKNYRKTLCGYGQRAYSGIMRKGPP